MQSSKVELPVENQNLASSVIDENKNPTKPFKSISVEEISAAK